MKIVLDTNVLVSGLLSPFGPPGEIVRMVSAGTIALCIDARVLAEYEDVLRRPRFGFDPDDITGLLEQIAGGGIIVAGSPLAEGLPDPDDEQFLEIAFAGWAEFLVSGNIAHYPLRARAGVDVATPSEFLGEYRERVAKERARR